MAAIKKEELARLEKLYSLEPGELTYQQRCSRITAYQKGEEWELTERERITEPVSSTDITKHPLYGKKMLISPKMYPDKNRMLYYEEKVGHDIQVEEAQAGRKLYGADASIDRQVSDYDIVSENRNRPVVAKSHVPKVNTQLMLDITTDRPVPFSVPIATGNDGGTGYLWSYPTQLMTDPTTETVIQVFGLKTLITMVYPDLLPEFRNAPMMKYLDGVTLVASIPQTNALLTRRQREDLKDVRLGLV